MVSACAAARVLALACVGALMGVDARRDDGSWGNVLGNKEVLPTDLEGIWAAEEGYKRLLAFVLEGINERWGRCRECSHVGRPELEALEAADQQLMAFTKDGKRPVELPLQKWDGEVTQEPLYMGLMYSLVLRIRQAEEAPVVTEGDKRIAAAYRTTRHHVVLHGDRNALFTFSTHTWSPVPPDAAEAPGDSAFSPFRGGDAAALSSITPLADEWFGVTSSAALTFICYNIWNFNPPWAHRLDLITSHIAKGPVPDILAFQEVRYDNAGESVGPEATRHQVDHLAWRMERHGLYQVVWAPAMSYAQLDQGLAVQTEGPAIMTRLPVLNVESIHLARFWPEDEGDEHQRLCLAVTVDTPLLGPVNVLTTHLTLSDDARMNNVYEICEWAKHHKEATLLMGDLNMIPTDRAMAFLTGREEYKGTTCDFVDVYMKEGVHRTHGFGERHVANGYTFNNLRKLEKRIDFILVRGGVDLSAHDVAMAVIGEWEHRRVWSRGLRPQIFRVSTYRSESTSTHDDTTQAHHGISLARSHDMRRTLFGG